MPAIIVVGTQWGDEGKGRAVDNFGHQAHLIARFNGGDNAGHTVIAEGHKLKLHLVPSGVLYPQATCLIGAGVVVHPAQLIRELDHLAGLGIDVGPERIKLSAAAHMILPTHRALDGARDVARGSAAIGTTRRGIGPVYADKAARSGLRAGYMDDPENFAERVLELVEEHNWALEEEFELDPLPTEQIVAQYCGYAQRLRAHLVDGSALVGETLEAGRMLLCEGAQGLLLDIDHGTYPYVTSSSTIAGGALTGLGFGPQHVERVVGIAKAYTTRVGGGPFPTELEGPVGDRMREAGDEFGTTTGRPRRCGWLDLTILRYAARVNGLTELMITKLDVLSGIDPLRMAVSYVRDDRRTDTFPVEYGAEELTHWEPVYEELPGWEEDISDVRERENLPPAAQAYVARIEEQVGVPISLISVGPKREQVIRK
jgi:adenylosuccinate synthase